MLGQHFFYPCRHMAAHGAHRVINQLRSQADRHAAAGPAAVRSACALEWESI
jgi:hypothetical protein